MTALSKGIQECDTWAKLGGHVPPLLLQAWTSGFGAGKEGWASLPGVPFQAGSSDSETRLFTGDVLSTKKSPELFLS